MNGVTELAMTIAAMKNPAPYTPTFGTIIRLPELQIQIGNKIFLDSSHIKAIFDIYEKEYDGEGNFVRYCNLGKEIVLLPYSENNKYVALGCVTDEGAAQ